MITNIEQAKSIARRHLASLSNEEMSKIYLEEYYTLPSPKFHKTILDKTLGIKAEAPPHTIV